jgi:hypothetical protein
LKIPAAMTMPARAARRNRTTAIVSMKDSPRLIGYFDT